MADKTKISWTSATWNPVTGCAKVSQGCKHCYAERDWARLSANPSTSYYGREFTDVLCHADRLDQPIRWKKPRLIFVNSMSDLFHEDVPDEFIDQVFAVMALCPQHTFQVLTKRPERMLAYMKGLAKGYNRLETAARSMGYTLKFQDIPLVAWPIRNIWLGVSIEDQATADERIPLLLQTPAAVRWISAEPLLGPVNLEWMDLTGMWPWGNRDVRVNVLSGKALGRSSPAEDAETRIDWVVVGGESGPKARPMHPEWAKALRDQCAAAGVSFFFKQWGAWAETECVPGGDLGGDMRRDDVRIVKPAGENDGHFRRGDALMRRVGAKAAGSLLDKVEIKEWPAAARKSTQGEPA